MLALQALRLVPTTCHLCGESDAHDVPNLCPECRHQLPEIEQSCTICSQPVDDDTSICVSCIKQTPTYDNSTTVYEYKKPLDVLFNRLKHHRDITVASTFAHLLAEKILHANKPLPDMIVPIPLNWKRQLSRGFNQSQCIAMLVAGRIGVPVNTKVLTRMMNTASQQGLSRSERLKNLDRCFHADMSVRDKHIALLDDVVTTGATMEAAATALYLRGTASISAWSIAKVPDPT